MRNPIGSRERFAIALSLLAMATGGCGKSDGGDEDTVVTCEEFDPWTTGGEGADVSVPAPDGEARAGRIASESGVPHGVKNKAEVGDFVLRNGRALFVIEDGGVSDGFQPFGGGIVHADLVGDDGEPLGLNNFGESFHGIAIRLLDPASVAVMNDGSDGGEAIVRVMGEMRSMPLLDVAFGFFFESNDGTLYVADYVLGPDSDYLEIRFQVRNPNPRVAYLSLLVFGSIQGDGLVLFSPEGGFDESALAGRHEMYGHVGKDLSYGWADAEGQGLRYAMVESGILVGQKDRSVAVDGCTELELPVIRLLVAGGGAEELLRAQRRMDGVAEPASTTFDLGVEGGASADGARVHVVDEGGTYVTSVLGASTGTAGELEWTAGLEPGDYLATVVADGHPVVSDHAYTVGTGAGSVAIEIPQAATVTYTVVDGDDSPVPGKIMVFPDVAPDPLPASFGEKTYPGAAATFVFDAQGQGSFSLPPGDYSVVAARGFEYEIDEQDFTAMAGEETVLSFVIDHSVDSTGMLCGDFHVHSIYSPDSSDPRSEKIRASAAEGVEILVSTDHEWVADYQPDIEAEGLQAWLHGVPGEELTTYDYGHMNVYPQTIRPDAPNDGAIDWYYRGAPEVFDEVHTDPLDPVLQLNHPRSSSSLGGYFNAAGFDPIEGTVSHPETWYTNFQAVEVWNGEDFGSQFGEGGTVNDWFALVSMGLKFSAMGNSDTHNYLWSEIGYPRSCLVVGHDDPETLTNVAVRDAVKQMKVFVSGGILVTAEGPAGEGPGEIADAPSGTVDFHVIVQAPTWIDAQRLRVFVSGVEQDPITLDASTADPLNPAVRFDDTIVVATPDGGDGWVVFEAEGDTGMDPVAWGNDPFGVTNPIYLDADGDSAFTPLMPLP